MSTDDDGADDSNDSDTVNTAEEEQARTSFWLLGDVVAALRASWARLRRRL